MQKALKKLTAVLFLLSLMVSPQAKQMPSYGMVEGESQEGLIKVDLPLPLVEIELKELLLSADSPVKRIDVFELDPIHNTLFLSGEIELPTSLLLTLEEQAERKLERIHSFKITLGFPSARLLSASRYALFRIHKFELDGIDYSKGFHIVSRVLTAVLSNRSLINYFMDDTKPPTDYQATDLSSQVKKFLDTKAIVFRDNTVRVRFALEEFTDLKRFAFLKDLRLWHFSPILLKGTKDSVAFRIEAGMGKPGQAWVDAAKERQGSDELSLREAREKLYREHSYNDEVERILKTDLNLALERTGIFDWSPISLKEIQALEHLLLTRARSFLNEDNNFFVADPIEAKIVFFREADNIISHTVLEIKKRQLLDNENRSGGRHGNALPIATKRFSQKALDQFTNFFRDFEFDNEPLFSHLRVVLAPQFPGIIIKGDVNLNLNTLFEMGLEGSGVDFSGPPVRFDENTYGRSLPFELSLHVFMRDDSIFELDIRNATVGEGQNKVILTPKTQKGDFLAEFTKMVTVNILKTYLISDPLGTSEEGDNPELKRSKLIEKIQNYKEDFQRIVSTKQKDEISDELIRLSELDLKNPLFDAPSEMAEEELTEFFKGLLDYDDNTGRVQINLSPRLFSEKISDADNTLQIWNFEPIFDKRANKTYFELSVGDHLRTKSYIDYLYNREERADSIDFTGTTGMIKDESPVDYSLKVNLSEFKNTINSILTASIDPQYKAIQRELRAPVEASYNLLEDISLTSAGSDLNLTFTLNSIEKKKKGLGSRIFGRLFNGDSKEYEINNSRATFSAKVGLSSIPLASVKEELLRRNPNEVFLGDSLIRLELKTIGRTVENSGFVSSLINKMIGNVDLESGLLGKNLKKLILKVAGPYLNASGNESGKTVLAGMHINQYAKIFTLDGDILFQINPRIAGPVWDFYPLKNQAFSSEKLGIFVDPKTETLNVDFKSAFAPSSVDKIKIYQLIKTAQETIKKVKNGEIQSHADLLKAYDLIFYNNDRIKKSLYHKLQSIIGNYQDLTFDQYNAKSDQFSFTSTGAELIHIASASLSLRTSLINLRKISSQFPEIQYDQQIKEIIDQLTQKFIIPSLDIYKKKYHENNERILARDITDWNFYVYPDALFAENTYQILTELL